MQRKSSRGCIEEEPKAATNDLSKEKVVDFMNICWRVVKVVLILLVIFLLLIRLDIKATSIKQLISSTNMTLDASHATQHVIYS